MITCQLESLNPQAESDLRQWLDKGPYSTLLKVAKAFVQRSECDALAAALDANGFNLKLESAQSHMAKAQRYATFISVLEEITQQRDPFQIAKLS